MAAEREELSSSPALAPRSAEGCPRQGLISGCLLQLYLRELLRLMHPRFHQHLCALGEDGLQMLFCHRWILLCFKREFPEAEALRMWEACWAHYQVRQLPRARRVLAESSPLSTEDFQKGS